MKRLRKHPRVDTLGTQQRAGSVRWGRLIYLSLVTAFAGSIAYYVAGNTVVLSADGIVLKDRYAVDAGYPAKVIEVFVKGRRQGRDRHAAAAAGILRDGQGTGRHGLS